MQQLEIHDPPRPENVPPGLPLSGRFHYAWPIAAALVQLAWSWAWLYRGGFGEGDCFAIATGLHEARHGAGLRDTSLYIPEGHLLYYGLLLHLPAVGGTGIDGLIRLMNLLGWFSGAVAMGLVTAFTLLAGASPRRALLASFALATSPVFFELGTYGHPVSLALALFLVGLIAWVAAFRRPAGALRLMLLALGAGGLLAGVAVRAELVLLAPAFCLLPALQGPRWRWPIVAAGLAVAAGALALNAWAAQVLLPLPAKNSLAMGQLVDFFIPFLNFAILPQGLVKLVIDAGPGLMLLAGLALTLAWRGGRRREALAALVMLAPAFAFVALFPAPARHSYLAAAACALVAATLGLPAWLERPGRFALAAVALLLLNTGLVPAGGQLLARLAPNPDHAIVRRLGQTIFQRHRINQAYLDWDRQRWAELIPSLRDGGWVIGRWREVGGLVLALERMRKGENTPVRRTLEKTLDQTNLFLVRAGSARIYFLEWYEGRTMGLLPQDPPRTVWVVGEPADALNARLPAARSSRPPGGLDFVYW